MKALISFVRLVFQILPTAAACRRFLSLLLSVIAISSYSAQALAQVPGAGRIPTNKTYVGQKSSADKDFIFDLNAGSSNPVIRAEGSSGRLKFSNDGVNFKSFGSGAGGGAGVNLLVDNADFESGSGFWTNSGGTWAVYQNSSASQPNYDPTKVLFDTASGVFDASTTGQYVETTAYTIPEGLKNTSCLARIAYRGGDANLKLQVYDGTGTIVSTNGTNAEVVLTSATNKSTAEVGFRCPSSGSIKLRVASTADAAEIQIDNAKLGDEDRFFRASQAQLLGTLTYVGAASCVWLNSASSYSNFSADSDCSTPTATGGLAAPGTKIPGFVIPSLEAGEILIVATGRFASNNIAGGTAAGWRFSDGTNVSAAMSTYGSNSYYSVPNLVGRLSYATTQSNLTIQIQSKVSANSAVIEASDAGAAGFGLEFAVYYFPSGPSSIYFNAAAPNDLTYVNDFSAQVSSAGTVTNENVDFVNGNAVTSGTSNATYTFTLNSGVFTSAPNCTADVGSNNSRVCNVITASSTNTTQVVNCISSATGSAEQGNFTLKCQRGSDYKVKSSILGYLSKSVTNPAGESASFSLLYGGASISTACTTNPCTIYGGNAPPGASVSYIATCNYELVVPAGTCSNVLACGVTARGDSSEDLIINLVPTNPPTSTTFRWKTQVSGTLAAQCSWGSVVCGCKK